MSNECIKDGLNFPPPSPVIAPTAPGPVPASDVRPIVSCNPEDFSKGIFLFSLFYFVFCVSTIFSYLLRYTHTVVFIGSSPSTSLFAMPVAMPTSIPSGCILFEFSHKVDA